MAVFRLIIILSMTTYCGSLRAAEPIEHVVLLAFDGLSVAGLHKARTPHLDALRDTGVLLTRSRGVMPTKSAPNWASILTGVYPDEHGIHSNQWWWFRFKRTLGQPTLFTALKNKQPESKTVALYEWKQFGRLFQADDLSQSRWIKKSAETIQNLTEMWHAGVPKFTVLHLVSADMAGHEYNWMSDAYIQGVEYVDAQVGAITSLLAKKGALKNTLIVVASDHGGVGDGHGSDSDTELYTPVIFNGPGVRSGVRLRGMTQNIDITATLFQVLGLESGLPLKGVPLKWVWQKD